MYSLLLSVLAGELPGLIDTCTACCCQCQPLTCHLRASTRVLIIRLGCDLLGCLGAAGVWYLLVLLINYETGLGHKAMLSNV